MRACVFVLSAALLAHEVCLLRALAIASWSHAASLVVSVALLGFGAAGTLLALAPGLRRPSTVAACAALYAVTVPLSLRAAAGVAFNVLEVGWDPSQWLRLLALQAVFLVPFLFGGLGIAVALALWRRRPGALYAWNLLGSGVGALLAVPLLAAAEPELGMGAAALAAALGALFVPTGTARWWAVAGVLVLLALGPASLPMSPFKDLPAAPNKTMLETHHSIRGRVDLVTVPSLHFAPGLSLLSERPLPEQRGLFVDGHLVAAVDRGASDYVRDSVRALPFVLAPRGRWTLGLGVGPDLSRVDEVVDADPVLLKTARVLGRAEGPRAFLDRTDERYPILLLDVPRRDTVHETPLLTVEGLVAARSRLEPGGVFAVSTGLTTPPRPGLKLLNTAEAVTPHVVAIRSMDHLTVALLDHPPTPDELERVRAFCDAYGFDLVRPLDHRPDRPHHETRTPLLDPGPSYPFDVEPATDARPYFHRFFRWSRLGDLLDRDAIPFVEWGFVTLLVAFAQVILLSLALLLLPLLFVRAARTPAPLFLALGLAYMLLEMAYLARATVRLGSPALAASVVLASFLVGSGAGSLVGERLGRPLARAALAAAVLAVPLLLLLPASPWGIACVALVTAFPMGMPFPAAIARQRGTSVPWALAVNGCASVSAVAAAPLISSTFSIEATAILGAALYLVVATPMLTGRSPAPTHRSIVGPGRHR